MKELYFDCPRKGRVLTLIFDNFEEITAENLKHLCDSKAERYVRILVKKENVLVYSMMIKFELGNQAIIDDTLTILRNDFHDLVEISKQIQI